MNDETLHRDYAAHLETVSRQWAQAMSRTGYDAVIVLAGEPGNYFLDDLSPPMRVNPHFLRWCPSEDAVGSVLLIRAGEQPRLYFFRPDDYWHQPPEPPVWAEAFRVCDFSSRDRLLAEVRNDAGWPTGRTAVIGERVEEILGQLPTGCVNPAPLLDHLHFHRARKTSFELRAMRLATRKAVAGHLAARDRFLEGGSEFDIHLAYLAASGQEPHELPYPNIIALNHNARVLHYHHHDRQAPARRLSFLIDAGGSHLGYAADITRTYPGDPGSRFAELVERLDEAQRRLVAGMQPGQPYLELHIAMHRMLAEILTDSGIASGDPGAVFESGLTETFLPHGLGHLIGLQTHDVGGQLSNETGDVLPPPENYPTLRLTRTLEEAMPVTIEPGLYFIPQLLEAARQGRHARLLRWEAIEALLPFGGIRIEDNVVLGPGGVENLTRDAFAELDARA